MQRYQHRVQYYETDMMGVVHHANDLHWMEEARIDLMDQLGFPYAEMERQDILSTVKSLQVEYRQPCSFGDLVAIEVTVPAFNRVVMTLAYRMVNQRGEVVCEAQSEHVFLSRDGRFVRLHRALPAFCAAVEALLKAPSPD